MQLQILVVIDDPSVLILPLNFLEMDYNIVETLVIHFHIVQT